MSKEINTHVGAIFCDNLHGYSLIGPVAEDFYIDHHSIMELDTELGQMIYNKITEIAIASGDNRRTIIVNKCAYVVSQREGLCEEEFIQILFFYDSMWYTAHVKPRSVC